MRRYEILKTPHGGYVVRDTYNGPMCSPHEVFACDRLTDALDYIRKHFEEAE
jgi:hypothetical protein